MNEPNPAAEEALFEAALERGSAAERASFLEDACRGNPQLRARLDELLEGYLGGAGFLTENPGRISAVISARAAASEPPSVMVGCYRLLEKIGEGGFGDVWMAEQREPVRRRVALKILKLGLDSR